MIQKKHLNSLVSGRNILVFSCWLLIKNSPHLYKIAYIYIYFGAALSTWYLHITGYSISSHLFLWSLINVIVPLNTTFYRAPIVFDWKNSIHMNSIETILLKTKFVKRWLKKSKTPIMISQYQRTLVKLIDQYYYIQITAHLNLLCTFPKVWFI